MQAPCLQCENAGCGSYHDECEIYKAFKAEQNELKAKKKAFRGEDVPRRPYRNHKVTPIKCHKK